MKQEMGIRQNKKIVSEGIADLKIGRSSSKDMPEMQGCEKKRKTSTDSATGEDGSLPSTVDCSSMETDSSVPGQILIFFPEIRIFDDGLRHLYSLAFFELFQGEPDELYILIDYKQYDELKQICSHIPSFYC